MKLGLIISAWWAATPDRNLTRITKTKDLCWEADQLIPSVPSKKTGFMGCIVAAPWGDKSSSKKLSSHKLEKKVVEHSENIQLYTCFILMKWNRHAFCFACSGKPKGEAKKQKAGNRKKATFTVERQGIFNLCHGHKSKSPKFFETRHPSSLHLYFFILIVLMQLGKLKAKGLWQSYWN